MRVPFFSFTVPNMNGEYFCDSGTVLDLKELKFFVREANQTKLLGLQGVVDTMSE